MIKENLKTNNKYLQFTKRRVWPSFDYQLADAFVYFTSTKLRTIKINMFI